MSSRSRVLGPLIPAGLSLLLPGAGQLANGDVGRALAAFGLLALTAVLPGPAASAVALGTWGWAVYDAYRRAPRD